MRCLRCFDACESVLECDFWHFLRKTARGHDGAEQQVKIGKYRVDCLIDCDGQRVVIELDGAEFHQDERKDWERTKEILRSVDAVIRIPYAAMHFYPQATMCVLGSWYPRLARDGDLFCMTVDEFMDELRSQDYSNGDFRSEEAWVDEVETCYELWKDSGWVGSPKAYLKRWNVKCIRRFTPSRSAAEAT